MRTTLSVDGADVADKSGSELDRTSTDLFGPPAMQSGHAEVSGDDVHLSDAARATALSWLSSAVVDGLVHCACSQHAVHPDLLTLAVGDTLSITTSRSAEDSGDAG